MNKWAAYIEHEWQFEVLALTEEDALMTAKLKDQRITRVELISECQAI